MPINGFSVGKDVVLDIIGPTGAVTFSLITGFTSKQMTNDIKVKGLDGLVRSLMLPEGWDGSFDITRQNSAVDDFFAALEDGYFNGQNTLTGTITETITEVNGSNTQYRYEQCSFKLDDAGDWKGDGEVKQKIGFYASRRKKVA